MVDAMLITAKTHDEILPILDTYGVAVIAIPVDETKLKEALKNTSFYNTANAIFKDEFKVPEPTMEEKLNPAVYKKRHFGDDAQGMLHQYGTPIHHLIQNNIQFRQSMTAIYGTGMKYLPNRLRKCINLKMNQKAFILRHMSCLRLILPEQLALYQGILLL